jgi:GT2 family glycosyltransferase
VPAIYFANKESLSSIYNEQIERAELHDVLVFIHDDVWLDDYFFTERVMSGTAQVDVIGLTGTRLRRPRQKAWSFVSDAAERDDPQYLSGRIAQGAHPCGRILYFGPSPAACQLLDGVLLAARAKTLKESGVRFDPRFKFHYYDLDFCREATSKQLRLSTWPVSVTHQSSGGFESPAWREACNLYFAKWGE